MSSARVTLVTGFPNYLATHLAAHLLETTSDHVVFENSGHFMWVEEPDRFFPLVGRWLDDHQRDR